MKTKKKVKVSYYVTIEECIICGCTKGIPLVEQHGSIRECVVMCVQCYCEVVEDVLEAHKV